MCIPNEYLKKKKKKAQTPHYCSLQSFGLFYGTNVDYMATCLFLPAFASRNWTVRL